MLAPPRPQPAPSEGKTAKSWDRPAHEVLQYEEMRTAFREFAREVRKLAALRLTECIQIQSARRALRCFQNELHHSYHIESEVLLCIGIERGYYQLKAVAAANRRLMAAGDDFQLGHRAKGTTGQMEAWETND